MDSCRQGEGRRPDGHGSIDERAGCRRLWQGSRARLVLDARTDDRPSAEDSRPRTWEPRGLCPEETVSFGSVDDRGPHVDRGDRSATSCLEARQGDWGPTHVRSCCSYSRVPLPCLHGRGTRLAPVIVEPSMMPCRQRIGFEPGVGRVRSVDKVFDVSGGLGTARVSDRRQLPPPDIAESHPRASRIWSPLFSTGT